MNPRITVVICTFNRFDLLPDAIASIELQDFSADSHELIIVDNSDDLEGQARFRDGPKSPAGIATLPKRSRVFPAPAISASMRLLRTLSPLWTMMRRLYPTG